MSVRYTPVAFFFFFNIWNFNQNTLLINMTLEIEKQKCVVSFGIQYMFLLLDNETRIFFKLISFLNQNESQKKRSRLFIQL